MAAAGPQLIAKSVPTKLPTERTQMIMLIKWVGGVRGVSRPSSMQGPRVL